MKKLLTALALISAGYAATTQAADVGFAITLGQPGYYGQLDMGRVGPPQVIYRQPMVVQRRNWNPAPVYLRVPQHQANHWNRYCGLYNACSRPVYFVRDDWYRNVYAPRYQRVHPNAQPYVYQRNDVRGDDRNYGQRYDDRYEREYDRRDNGQYDRDHDHDRH